MSAYLHIELSDPTYERDHLRLLTFRSPALQSRGEVTLFIPPEIGTAAVAPLVMLLHGVYGSHWSWAWRGGAHITARRLIAERRIRPVVIAMPSDGLRGDGTGYLPQPGADYEKWIVDDVTGCVREVVPHLEDTSPLFISGLSMGGYGALRLGAKYATRFSGISAHSSVVRLEHLAQLIGDPPSEEVSVEARDFEILRWVRHNRTVMPPLRFDCGTSDPLIDENRKLHLDLLDLEVPHEFSEFDGDHSWTYWREHLVETLLFFDTLW